MSEKNARKGVNRTLSLILVLNVSFAVALRVSVPVLVRAKCCTDRSRATLRIRVARPCRERR